MLLLLTLMFLLLLLVLFQLAPLMLVMMQVLLLLKVLLLGLLLMQMHLGGSTRTGFAGDRYTWCERCVRWSRRVFDFFLLDASTIQLDICIRILQIVSVGCVWSPTCPTLIWSSININYNRTDMVFFCFCIWNKFKKRNFVSPVCLGSKATVISVFIV